MILDSIENASRYFSLHPRIARGLGFLRSFSTESFVPGREEIEGEALFALRQAYLSKPREKGLWEAHRRYADIQFIHEGRELLGVAPLVSMRTNREYTEEGDYALYEGEGQFFVLPPKGFAILFPEDVHMPGIAVDQSIRVRKIVVKVEL